MRLRRISLLVAAGALTIAGLGAGRSARGARAFATALGEQSVPTDNPATAPKIELGRRLFYDADLSADGSMACATCHEQHRGFADGNRTHSGVHGDPARRNVPGLANVAWLRTYTWGDPRIRTLEAQVLVPVLGDSPIEMGMHGREADIVTRLARNPCYRAMFAWAFPEVGGKIAMPQIAKALASFERSLLSFDTPYDRALRGGPPLNTQAQRGAAVFARDCKGCHRGPLLTDGRFHRVLPPSPSDRGLGEITGRAADDGRIRTPSLRNVALTAPYFHDGSASTLATAIDRHPGVRSPADVTDLTAFLDTLTDVAFVSDKRFSYPDNTCSAAL